MQTGKLGRQGLTALAIGYGAMGTAVGYGTTDDTQPSRRSAARTTSA